jgi:hypothetical protein
MNDNKLKLKIGEVTISFPRVAAERMYEEVKKIIGNGKLSTSNVVRIVISLMQIVETYVDLKGEQKKGVVIEALLYIIDQEIKDEIKKEQFKQLVLVMMPAVVDAFVQLDRSKLKIKKTTTITHLFRFCFPSRKRPKESNFYAV